MQLNGTVVEDTKIFTVRIYSTKKSIYGKKLSLGTETRQARNKEEARKQARESFLSSRTDKQGFRFVVDPS